MTVYPFCLYENRCELPTSYTISFSLLCIGISNVTRFSAYQSFSLPIVCAFAPSSKGPVRRSDRKMAPTDPAEPLRIRNDRSRQPANQSQICICFEKIEAIRPWDLESWRILELIFVHHQSLALRSKYPLPGLRHFISHLTLPFPFQCCIDDVPSV